MESKDKTKLRILAAGDIHGDTAKAKKLAEQAEKENNEFGFFFLDFTYSQKTN